MAKVVVIDPGHGGRDSGAVGRKFGVKEKDINLQAALLLRDALRRCGVKVVMTRETDIWPSHAAFTGQDLEYRAQIANDADADLFVSWHYDAADDSRADGVAVWIHPITRGTQTETWAQKIVTAMAAATGQRDRGVRYGNYQVLRDTAMDAVLIEGGFLTNADEEEKVRDRTFIEKQAEGAARGICAALGVSYVAPVAVDPTTDAIRKLVAAGVIESPNYWLANARTGEQANGEYVGLLIQKMATKLDKK